MSDTETIAPARPIPVLVTFLRAALACASTETSRANLCGVHLRRSGANLDVVASDGQRLFLGRQPLPKGEELPDWLEPGIIIQAEGLKPRLALLAADGDLTIRVEHSAGNPRVTLTDVLKTVVFRQPVVDAAFPDYRQLVGTFADTFTPEQPLDFKPVGFKAGLLKGAAELAKILCGKEDLLAVYANEASGAAAVTFPACPGALLYMMSQRAPETMAEATSAILTPAIRGTLAALRAHQTRHLRAAQDAAGEAERGAAKAKADEIGQRIAAILHRTRFAEALPAPAAEKPEAKPDTKPAKGKAGAAKGKPDPATAAAPAPATAPGAPPRPAARGTGRAARPAGTGKAPRTVQRGAHA